MGDMGLKGNMRFILHAISRSRPSAGIPKRGKKLQIAQILAIYRLKVND